MKIKPSDLHSMWSESEMKEESSIDCISPWLHYKVCFIQALKVQFYFQIWALCLPSSLLLSICPQRATCPSVLASTPFLSTNSIHPSLCPSSWMQTQAFQWLSSSFWLKSCGWSPGATVTRCWLAVVALVWATQLPDSLSPIWIVLIIPSVWLGNPSVCQSRTFSFLIMFFSLVCWSAELKMYLWEQRNMIQAVHCRQDQKKNAISWICAEIVALCIKLDTCPKKREEVSYSYIRANCREYKAKTYVVCLYINICSPYISLTHSTEAATHN